MRILDNLIYRAEELDEVKIQYRLAVIYQTGDRVEQDLGQARHWFERAAENGHEEAARILATMGGTPVELKAPKITKAKKRGDSKVKSSADDLPPVIQSKTRRQSLDIESGLEGTTDCPHGHGPLQDWEGDLRCWICGWTNNKTAPAESTRVNMDRSESSAENLGRKLGLQLGNFFGKKSGAASPQEKAEEIDSTVGAFAPEEGMSAPTKKKSGIGCDAVWIVGGIIYLLARSCSE